MLEAGLSRERALEKLEVKGFPARDLAVEAQLIRRLMMVYARAGEVVLVGRGAQVVLQDFASAIQIRVQAPESLRILRMMKRMGIERREAERCIRQSDRVRARYLQRFYQAVWNDPDLYHLILNTGRVSVDLAVSLIVQLAAQLGAELPH